MINPKNSNFSDKKKNTVNDEQRAFYMKNGYLIIKMF